MAWVPTLRRSDVESVARDVLDNLEIVGMIVDEDVSRTSWGISVYLSAADRFEDPSRTWRALIRVSDHTVGAARWHSYHHVLSEEDGREVVDRLVKSYQKWLLRAWSGPVFI